MQCMHMPFLLKFTYPGYIRYSTNVLRVELVLFIILLDIVGSYLSHRNRHFLRVDFHTLKMRYFFKIVKTI